MVMPVCALFSCITVGWILKPETAVKELTSSGTVMSAGLKKVFCFMVKFVTPVLILIVEIGGLKSEIESGQYAVIVAAVLFIAVWTAVYFAFFKNTDTGTNEDEKL